jgi:beta-lactamase class A
MKKINSIALSFASLVVGGLLTFWIMGSETTEPSPIQEIQKSDVHSPSATPYHCDDISVLRENELALVKPLLLLNYDCESKELDLLKEKISLCLDSLKSSGIITRSGVYFKELNTLRWTGVNYHDTFYPGSMMKVPMMINILKAAETTPGLLEREFVFQRPAGLVVSEPPLFPLEVGRAYKVKELILSMIADSNNDATQLLAAVNDKTSYQRLFSELGLETPQAEDLFYSMSAMDYAKFFRVLYNATYLIHENSQYAMEILLKTKFNGGFKKYLPSHAKVAHKFGERFTEGDLTQFHETGIVYSGGSSYLLVIMTEGSDRDKLKEVVAKISMLCFKMHSKGFGSSKVSADGHHTS